MRLKTFREWLVEVVGKFPPLFIAFLAPVAVVRILQRFGNHSDSLDPMLNVTVVVLVGVGLWHFRWWLWNTVPKTWVASNHTALEANRNLVRAAAGIFGISGWFVVLSPGVSSVIGVLMLLVTAALTAWLRADHVVNMPWVPWRSWRWTLIAATVSDITLLLVVGSVAAVPSDALHTVFCIVLTLLVTQRVVLSGLVTALIPSYLAGVSSSAAAAAAASGRPHTGTGAAANPENATDADFENRSGTGT